MANGSQIPFNPLGETVAITANVAPPLGVQALVESKFGAFAPGQYRVINNGTLTVHLGTGSTAAQAQSNAVAAVSGNPAPSIPSFLVLLRSCASTLDAISARQRLVRPPSISRQDRASRCGPADH